MSDAASRLRAQLPTSTDKYRLEREARRAEVRGERRLLDRLHDLEAAMRIDGFYMFACDVRDAIDLLQSYNAGDDNGA